MALKTVRSKEFAPLIGELIRFHIRSQGPSPETSIHAVEGILIDVSDNFLYIGENVEEGYTAILDINVVYMATFVGEAELMNSIPMPEDGDVH